MPKPVGTGDKIGNVVNYSVLMVTNTYPTAAAPYAGSAVKMQEIGLRTLGVQVQILFLERAKYGQRVYLTAAQRIRAAAQDCAADLVHVQFGGIQALQAVRAMGRRTVLTFHGTDLHGGNPGKLSQKLSYRLGVWASRWAARRAGWNIVVASGLQRYLTGVTERVQVIPTGVDYDLFFPQPREDAKKLLTLDETAQYIVFCDANHDPIKRADLARAALQVVQAQCPKTHLLELHQVAHHDVPVYLNASACVLVTSDKEGSPNIVKEAIACNVPVVSVDVGDIAERIKGIANCHIVGRHPAEIGAAILHVLNNGGRADGREDKRDDIENLAVCQKILRVYQKILSDRGV